MCQNILNSTSPCFLQTGQLLAGSFPLDGSPWLDNPQWWAGDDIAPAFSVGFRIIPTKAGRAGLIATAQALGASEMSRIFQTIRVVVLEEMPRLETFLERAADWIVPGGRVVFLTYASHEDRRVKHSLGQKGGAFVPLQKKPIAPSYREVAENRRARSAKLRAYERKG